MNLKHNYSNLGLILSAVFLSILCLIISTKSQSYAELSLSEFSIIIIFAIVIWLFAYILSKSTLHLSKNWIIAASVSFQLCLLPAYPVLENDILRYLWDGFMFVETGNPYGITPDAFYADEQIPAVMQTILNLVAYPNVPTVYGPFVENIFAAAYILSPGNELFIKIVMALSVIGITFLIAPKISASKLLLFSWCPLVLFQFSLNGHTDSLALIFLVAALIYYNDRAWWLAPVLLMLAVTSKIFAVLAIPFVLVSKKQYLLLFLLLSVIYIPLIISGKHEFLGLSAMAESWMFNSLFYSLWTLCFDNLWIKPIFSCIFILTFIYFSFKVNKSSSFILRCRFLFYVYAIFLLGLSTINAWYLLWLLCFAIFTPYRWPWIFSCTIWCYLFTGLNTANPDLGAYEIPIEILIFEFFGIILFSQVIKYFSDRRLNKTKLVFATSN